jgi:hypothetical protein
MTRPQKGGLPMPVDETLEIDAPRFCPRCRARRPSAELLCGLCGEKLRDQGYCGICEEFWLLPTGAECPKHEVTLDDRPHAQEAWSESGEPTQLVTVGTFANTGRADAARIRLEAEGIPTFLEGERMGNSSMYPVATGGIRLQVPQPFVADARVLLDQTWAPPVVEENLDDAWDELAPDSADLRRSIMKGLILVLLFGPLAIAGLLYVLRL